MRMMVTISLPVATGNAAIRAHALNTHIGGVMERCRPESAYFYLEGGRRTMRAVFDLEKTPDMVRIFEPVILDLEADVTLTPVMSAEELAAGFASLG